MTEEKIKPYQKCRFLSEVLSGAIEAEEKHRELILEAMAMSTFTVDNVTPMTSRWNITTEGFKQYKENYKEAETKGTPPVIINNVKLKDHMSIKIPCGRLQKLPKCLDCCFECLDRKVGFEPTLKLDIEMPFEKIKEECLKHYQKSGRLRFLIPNNDKIQGRILSRLDEFQNTFRLIQRGIKLSKKKGEAKERLFFIDERPNKNAWMVKDILTEDYWLYIVVTKKKKYYLLSSEDLSIGEYIIDGLIIPLEDMLDATPNLKLKTQLPLFFHNTAKKVELSFNNHQELIKFCKEKKLNHNSFFNYLFSRGDDYSYRHPKEFEELIGAWLFHAKRKGLYPLHLCLISEPDCGKTWLIEHIADKFSEEKFFAPNSTLKGLVPSYKKTFVKMGHLIQSRRIAPVDEFLKIPLYESNDELIALNSILEHKEQMFGSGNSSQKGMMIAKGLFGTNPPYHTRTIAEVLNLFPMSTMQRLFLYKMGEEHHNFILEEKGREPQTSKLEPKELMGLYDYLNSFVAEFDAEKVRAIFNSLKDEVSGIVSIYYKARMGQVFVHCLMDGLIKLRCLFAYDDSFKAIEADYTKLELILTNVIKGYNEGEFEEEFNVKEPSSGTPENSGEGV